MTKLGPLRGGKGLCPNAAARAGKLWQWQSSKPGFTGELGLEGGDSPGRERSWGDPESRPRPEPLWPACPQRPGPRQPGASPPARRPGARTRPRRESLGPAFLRPGSWLSPPSHCASGLGLPRKVTRTGPTFAYFEAIWCFLFYLEKKSSNSKQILSQSC